LKHITATFLRGLVTLLPILLTVYILYWLAVTAESLLGTPLKVLLPDWMYRPGLGLLVGVVLVFGVGLVMELYVARRLWGLLERALLQVPVVKTLYGAIKDFAGFVSESSKQKGMGQVVRVRVADHMHLLGFVTREDFAAMPAGLGGADVIAVYLPMSYQVGGYTVLLPRKLVEPVDMSVEDALRFAVTAGMSQITARQDDGLAPLG
jgi:uncharacterized membrane protein